jgi:hypothetical protein
MWRIAHDSPPYARRNGDVSISTLLDVSLRGGRSQPIDNWLWEYAHIQYF